MKNPEEFLNNPAEEILKYADEFGLHSIKEDLLLNSILLRPGRKGRIDSFKRYTARKVRKYQEAGIPFKPVAEDADVEGDVIAGKEIFSNREIGIRWEEFLKQGVVYAATGFYKTFFTLNIAEQAVQSDIPVIIIDKKGRQFRSLQRAHPDKVLVMKADGQLPYNPCATPRGCSKSEYLPGFVEIRSRIFERHDSTNMFQEILLNESNKYNNGEAPCEHDLHNANIRSRFRRGFADSNLKRLRLSLANVSGNLVKSSFGRTLAYRKDLDLTELIEKRKVLVIEASNLTLTQLEYLATTLLHKLNTILRSQSIEQDRLKAFFIIDEASEILRERQGIPPIIELATKIRQAGIGLLAGMHAPHLAHSMFRTNAYFTCCFRLGSDKAIKVVKDSMFLNAEQTAYIPTQEVKMGIITLGDRHPSPIAFIALDPIIPFSLNISDKEIEQGDQEILKTLQPVIPWKGDILTITEQDFEDALDLDMAEENTAEAGVMSSSEQELLNYVLHRFNIPITKVYRELDWSMEKGDVTSSSVVRKNLATEVRLNPSGKPGGLSRFLVHTDKFFLISGKEKPVPGTDGKGAEHCLMLRFIVKDLEEEKQCKDIQVSRFFNGAVSDIYFKHNGSAYVVEVCCSTVKTEADKLCKIFNDSEVMKAFIITKDREVMEKLKERFQDFSFRNKITLCRLSDFLNSELDELLGKTGEV